MIKNISIENFKGIGNRVSVELKPITLLFGSNSAGKSTIFHALHYFREIFERHNIDPDLTLTGGSLIELGGFASFVHNHDKTRNVVIRIDVSVDELNPPFTSQEYSAISKSLGYEVSEIARCPKLIGAEISVSWSDLENCPYVNRYSVFFDGELFVDVEAAPNLRSVMISKIVYDHPILLRFKDVTRDPYDIDLFQYETIIATAMWNCFDVISPGDGKHIELSNQKDAFPNLNRNLCIEKTPFLNPNGKEGQERLEEKLKVADEIGQAIGDLIIGASLLVKNELSGFYYLGPYRETPPRNHNPPRYPEAARWANGLAAWDQLGSNLKIVEGTNTRLSGPDSLQIGYQLRLKEVKEIPLSSPLLGLLLAGRGLDDLEDIPRIIQDYPTRSTLCLVDDDTGVEVFPSDVGIGISQLIPVIVLSLDAKPTVVAVEQPELHVHPAVQVRLGDLFIRQIDANPSRIFILETHSEHLMLRLLRRIRETTENELPLGHPGLTYDKVNVIYVENCNSFAGKINQTEGVSLRLKSLRIDETGDFKDPWPQGFFDERGEELFGQ